MNRLHSDRTIPHSLESTLLRSSSIRTLRTLEPSTAERIFAERRRRVLESGSGVLEETEPEAGRHIDGYGGGCREEKGGGGEERVGSTEDVSRAHRTSGE